MDVRAGEREAGEDRGNAPVGERGDERDRPAGAEEERAAAEDALEGVLGEADGGSVRRDQPRRGGRPPLDLQLGALGRSLAQEALERRGDLLDVLPGREPDGDVGLGENRQDCLLEDGLAAVDPVDVDRRGGERAEVELVGRLRVQRLRAGFGEHVRSRVELLPRPDLLLGRRNNAGAQLVRQRHDRLERPRKRVHGIQGRAAEHAGVKVALAGPQRTWK